MKKIISLMLVTIMMILSLTSCDLLDRFFDEKIENEVENNTQKEDNTPAQPEETRYTITEEEWENILNSKNFTMHCILDGIVTNSETGETIEYVGIIDLVTKISENALYQKQINSGDFVAELYYEAKDNGKSYRINVLEDGTLDVTEGEQPDITLNTSLGFADIENWIYDEEKKAYIVNTPGLSDFYCYDGLIYFENGNLVKIISTGTNQAEEVIVNFTITYTFSNFGTTVVNVPEYEIDSNT